MTDREPPADSEGRQPDAEKPEFSVVGGNPTDAELAAVLAVLQSRRRAAATAPPGDAGGGGQHGAGSGWSAYWRAVRAPQAPGPGAWRASGRS